MFLGQLSLSQTYACMTGKPRTALAEARLAVGSLKTLTGDKDLTRKDEFFFFFPLLILFNFCPSF